MNGQFEPPHSNGAIHADGTDERARPRSTVRRNVILAVVVLVCVAWGYAIWYSVTRESPEDLDDAAAAQVGDACNRARDELETLPDFTSDSTAADNVELVRQENEIFDRMINDIAAVEPSSDDATTALGKWIDDWRALLGARTEFADALETTGTARLEIPSISSGSLQPISDRMNDYARQRGLDVCQPDALQAEAVDGPRDYTLVED